MLYNNVEVLSQQPSQLDSRNSAQPNLVDCYQTLQIRRDATNSEIRHNYRLLSLWNHPGRQSSSEERAKRLQMFEVLAACYETLMEKDVRRRYDALLKEMELRNKGFIGDIRLGGKPILPTRKTGEMVPELGLASFSFEEWKNPPGANAAGLLTTNNPAPNFFLCGAASSADDSRIPSLLTSSSTMEGGEVHYTEGETNRLFGGPLQLLFRARRWRPFADPFEVFSKVFGSRVSLGQLRDIERSVDWTQLQSSSQQHPTPVWSNASETLPNGLMIYTTTRVLKDRKFIRTEVVRTDPQTGQKQSYITVTSEPVEPPKDVAEQASCITLDACTIFSSDIWSSNLCGSWLAECEK